MFRPRVLLGLPLLLTLAACSTPHIDNGQYWQRSSVSEAAYMEGPKAQQMLNRDISRCVVELRELEGLGSVKDAIPAARDGTVLSPKEMDEKQLEDWDTPERDGALLAEHTDYTDFEGCMTSKGWERVKYVPFEVATKARKSWFKANVNYDDPRDAPMSGPSKPNEYEKHPADSVGETSQKSSISSGNGDSGKKGGGFCDSGISYPFRIITLGVVCHGGRVLG